MYIITGITALTTYLLCSPPLGQNRKNENRNNKHGYLEYVPPSEACTVSPLYYYTFEEEEL